MLDIFHNRRLLKIIRPPPVTLLTMAGADLANSAGKAVWMLLQQEVTYGHQQSLRTLAWTNVGPRSLFY